VLVKVIFQVMVFEGIDELDAITLFAVLRRSVAAIGEWHLQFATVDGTFGVTACSKVTSGIRRISHLFERFGSLKTRARSEPI
jgi:hypothetical protein